jgi:hypothetical protein
MKLIHDLMRIIFLDIDGVLCPYGSEYVKTFKPSCVGVLKEILLLTGARIVISSSWRLGEMERLMKLMNAEGLGSHILGTTTCDVLRGPKSFRGTTEEQNTLFACAVSRSRPMEIQLWLDEHPDIDPKNCIAIDDEKDAWHRIIAPQSSVGLEPRHVKSALYLFDIYQS